MPYREQNLVACSCLEPHRTETNRSCILSNVYFRSMLRDRLRDSFASPCHNWDRSSLPTSWHSVDRTSRRTVRTMTFAQFVSAYTKMTFGRRGTWRETLPLPSVVPSCAVRALQVKETIRVIPDDERGYTFLGGNEYISQVIRMPLYEKEHDPKKHEKHLCRLMEAGTTLTEYSALAFKGVYVCKECGRVANAEECLCEPVDMRKLRF